MGEPGCQSVRQGRSFSGDDQIRAIAPEHPAFEVLGVKD